MTPLQPIIDRRGFAVGGASLRVGNLFYGFIFVLAFAGFVVGSLALGEVLYAISRSS